jgi:hypothetical protein
MWSRAVLLRVVAVLLLTGGLCGCASGSPTAQRGSGSVTAAAAPAAPAHHGRTRACTVRGLGVLDRWDRARAAAYAHGDAARLRRLYAAGSGTGAADVQVLRRYAARGLVVAGMRRQVLDARARGCTGKWLVLRVTDRLAGAVAVGRGLRHRLPSTGDHRWLLTFRAAGHRWVLARALAR